METELENAAEMYERMEQEKLEESFSKDSYNPQFDFLLQYRNGQTLASVYGKIWRYCQMKRGRCEVSIQRVADEINIGYSTAKRAVGWLCENGLVYDTTPDAGRHIHKYGVNEDEHKNQTIASNMFRSDQRLEIHIID